MESQEQKVFKIKLKFKDKEYICDGFCWYEEGWGWVSPHEFGGVRNCEHDYASLLPSEVYRSQDFGCEQKEIEVIDYWFEDLSTANP